MNIVDAIDRVANACEAESTLRRVAMAEFARGISDGPMKLAHDAAVQECIDAAHALIELADQT